MASPGYPREHIDSLLTGIRAEMATRSELRTEIAGVRMEIAGLRGELRTEMADLRGGLRTEMADFRGELRTEMADFRGELRTEMTTMEGRLSARIEGLRGEWKVWMLVMGGVLAVVSSGVGNRVLNLLWPAGPGAPPVGYSSPLHR